MDSAKKPIILLESYFSWHYGRAFVDMFHIWMNFLWFVVNFFSISAIIGTFFDPWKRMGERYPKGLDITAWITAFTVNGLMRFVGIMIRTTVLAISFVFLSVVFFVGIAVFLAWTFMPVVFVALVIISLHLIFYA
ncbi:MAG: hypothetical protein HYT94_00715 [Parcubacteria group bacterium]|nr:hypothetical protein [Parcubacteria group bacterium]